MPVADVPLPGRHMLSNVLAAALGAHAGRRAARRRSRPASAASAACRIASRPSPTATACAGSTTRRPPSRWPPSRRSTRSSRPPMVLIAGGRGKGLDYVELADAIARRASAAILIGETAAELEGLMQGTIPRAPGREHGRGGGDGRRRWHARRRGPALAGGRQLRHVRRLRRSRRGVPQRRGGAPGRAPDERRGRGRAPSAAGPRWPASDASATRSATRC